MGLPLISNPHTWRPTLKS